MAHINIFKGDGFSAMALGEAIRMIPNQWGTIGAMGLFTAKAIRGTVFSIEKKDGVLQLVQSSERGSPLPGQARGKRKMVDFRTERFGLKSRITADDIDNIRAFGSETELKQAQDEVMDRQEELRGSIDITREYHRAGALQGVVLDADGSELMNLFDKFEINRKSVDFTFGTATTDLAAKCKEVTRHIRLNLMGDVMAGVGSLIHPDFTDKLMGHADFKERYKYYQNANGGDPLRDDTSDGFEFGGIRWKEYLAEAPVPQEDGTTVTRSFIGEAKAAFFPLGTRQTFRTFNGSPDYVGMANTPGRDFYSAVFPDRQEDRFVDVEAMMQNMQICMRPGVLVEGRTSN
ncbi:minor capsid protein E [Salipiger pallidus]|uniref:Minor capsid protein E n=1 Tax=Salipiger pallidus TaxID=1775170 RepID=A0A8J2ZGE8_9RHOB|nr:major capsid protein [Salipiger pallidus]GGG59806.1 minor capsid protein E [Salipiger pallidus]